MAAVPLISTNSYFTIYNTLQSCLFFNSYAIIYFWFEWKSSGVVILYVFRQIGVGFFYYFLRHSSSPMIYYLSAKPTHHSLSPKNCKWYRTLALKYVETIIWKEKKSLPNIKYTTKEHFQCYPPISLRMLYLKLLQLN